ncbi:MBL fold metallo-hydrolase [Candidatus Woesearchaeota archaeon]|nr:MBL fold metallo-hydrolase [Candidatus Woesearchaeota archaeon]
MEDRIIFLGTGGDHFVTGKQILGSGGIILQTEGMQFHIDPGPGALTAAKQSKIHPRETTAILVSHAHIGHCNDVNALISAATYAGFDRQSVLIANKTLVDDRDNNKPLLTDFHRECVERVIVVIEGNKVGINDIQIDALKTVHHDSNGVGFKFTCPKFTLVYTGDTEYFPEMEELYKESDVIIFNMQEPFDKKEKGHLSPEDVIKVINAVKPKVAVVTHFGNKLLSEDPLETAREIQRQTGVQTIVPKDGTQLNPVSHKHAVM